jgi:hypothetical protein
MMAIGALLSGSALAEKFSVNTWMQYKNCPVNDPAMEPGREVEPGVVNGESVCIFGQTLPGEKGGYFSLGTATVKLNKPVTIQAGVEVLENEELEITGYRSVAPTSGSLVEAPELKVVGGLKLFTKRIQEVAKWPTALQESFKAAVANKETKVGVTLEVAGGNLVYETPNSLDIQNLIEETGTTFILPFKVTLHNAWLEKLGGPACTIGNEEHPVIQNLTSAPPGWWGTAIHFNPPEFTNTELEDSKLTDLSWPVDKGSFPSGCGGAENEQYIDGALDEALKLTRNAPTGTTVLQGNLFSSNAGAAKKELGL